MDRDMSAQIAWLRDLREHEQRQLELIGKGWRFQSCIGTQRRNDVTDEMAERARAAIDHATRLIDALESRAA